MKIENIRTLGRTLLFTASSEEGDSDVTILCDNCVLRSNGCSGEGTRNGGFNARVNLDSNGVKSLVKNNLSAPCGATVEIKFKA